MITSRLRWQFSLFSLFVLSTVVAVAIVLWQWCPVTGVSLSGADVVFHMSDNYVPGMMPKDPYFDTLAESPDVFFHDAYVKIPIYVVATGLLIIAGCLVVVWLAIRRWRCRT